MAAYFFIVIVIAAVVVLIVGLSPEKEGEKTTIQPPVADKIEKELTIHGDTRIDPYFWLNQRENPKVIEYLKAENAYLEAMMKDTEGLQEKLFEEIIGRIKQTDMSVPYKKRGYYYYTRYEEGKEYPVYCRKKGSLEADEEILLNVNTMAEGFDYFHVTGLSVSPDNQMLSYGVDTVSRRKYTLRFKNLKTGELLDDEIPNTSGRAAWADDNRTVFYALKDETLRPYKIFRHVLETDAGRDDEIFHEADSTFNTYVFRSKSDKYIFIASDSTLSSEFQFLKTSDPQGTFRIVHPRERDLEYQVDHFQDHFYIRTNDQAKNFRLMKTPVEKTEKSNWTEVLPHREDVLLEGFEIFKDHLVVEERQDGLSQLRVKTWDGGSDYYMDMEEETYSVYISTNPEFDTPLLRYGYTSLTTPNSIYDFDMTTKEKTLLKREEVLGEFDPAGYHAERLYAPAKDGVRVPISLVYRKGLEKEGQNPLLLYGYGSYGASMDPSFRSDRLSLLDRGFIFAIAHIRGGQEMGRTWYEDGKLLKKKNTFTDFIACAEYLIEKKYTNPEKLFAQGGSAGGLLMGAVVNMKPGLFKGVIAAVPWVDVVTTMLDESIPLTTSEYDEWGNPNDKEYYDYMLSYSPYDNVTAQDYPNMLVTTGLHDSQVQYWEPAKWVAKLRELKTDNHLLLLHTNMEAGHSGASGRFRRYKETALMYAFMLDLLGIKE
ncbi:MAG: S9 family peptidase [Candidatus Aminicenantes bacterium]|nr:S9 family peptidase [Candidatus Aminicenantes bacterium]